MSEGQDQGKARGRLETQGKGKRITGEFCLLVVDLLWEKARLPGSSVQFSSVAQSRLTLCNPMDCSTPGLPIHHQLWEFTPGLFFPNYQKSKRVPEKHLLLLYSLCQSL